MSGAFLLFSSIAAKFPATFGSNVSLEALWARVHQGYTEPQRFYHTLTHIEDLLRLTTAAVNANELKDGDLVALAVVYHDIVYDPTRNDNEEQSAELFRSQVAVHLPDLPLAKVDAVAEWILATKLHTTPEHLSRVQGHSDLHKFLDFDMSVLSWPAAEYDKYASQIRQEYIHVPLQIYNDKRPQLLEKFLETPAIFTTAHYKGELEKLARDNLKREIATLRAITPACKS
ncbi:hypothetical protein CAOG_01871 [Capsaspora owczarzaki ATCC 30864]|uniref:Metal-dependent HD superfamily phosphohydrolase n=1 Tax=Capsaspora owczarzaki (strain ATCC 30864) TaxID=595528 RepID=A0A0D2WLA5_CAPO3|nr:hypothetical protein CAOG_01871 [Capsaspora owczarzaki ATCC 30864]KJE90573.1 hypothetical protein CAOG_001871 [Capsaspora owczarzaki ATCC 30864]|eukprot:XP_004364739.1 hypothetical protein CAOG_01871 [Capsaspora owczarzaki ATCC 30864]